jgi:hypothetical protein
MDIWHSSSMSPLTRHVLRPSYDDDSPPDFEPPYRSVNRRNPHLHHAFSGVNLPDRPSHHAVHDRDHDSDDNDDSDRSNSMSGVGLVNGVKVSRECRSQLAQAHESRWALEKPARLPRIPEPARWGIRADALPVADDPNRVVTVTASSGKTGAEVQISYTSCKVVGNGSFGVVFAAKMLGESGCSRRIFHRLRR